MPALVAVARAPQAPGNAGQVAALLFPERVGWWVCERPTPVGVGLS